MLKLLAAIFSVTATVHSLCPRGWTAFNQQKCLKLFDVLEERDQAEATCSGEGGNLLNLHSKAEEDFVVDHLAAGQFAVSAWLAAVRPPNGDFMANGTTLRYENWLSPSCLTDHFNKPRCLQLMMLTVNAINGACYVSFILSYSLLFSPRLLCFVF